MEKTWERGGEDMGSRKSEMWGSRNKGSQEMGTRGVRKQDAGEIRKAG